MSTENETPDTALHVSWLVDMLDALTRYSKATGRLGLHDLTALETLRDRRDSLAVDPQQAMIRFIDKGEAVFIGGPKGYVWEGYDEEVMEAAERIGVVTVCDRHGGAWGDDETCPRCTYEDGTARPQDAPGPLTNEDDD